LELRKEQKIMHTKSCAKENIYFDREKIQQITKLKKQIKATNALIKYTKKEGNKIREYHTDILRLTWK
jgi:Holliday junction resolvase